MGVHDAVRPLVSVEVIRRTYSAAAEQEAAYEGLMRLHKEDSIKII